MAAQAQPRLHDRLAVASRVLAAIPANYVLTSVIVALLARLLPMPPHEASVAATLASFAIFAGIALAVFHARSMLRTWAWLIGLGLGLGALLALSLQAGVRL